MTETEIPRVFSFGARLGVAALTSLAGAVLFFAIAMAFVVGTMPFLKGLGEPAASVLMYAIAFGVAGVAVLAFDGRVLRLRWVGTAEAMVFPYLLVLVVPLAGGLAHLSLSRNSFGFAHSWLALYLFPVAGACAAVGVAGGTLAVEAARRAMRRALGRRHGGDMPRAG